ncbi:hypothetical protein NLJ89_g9137 [Agrocybe chaxingu]|uniref:Uncharacterized protein n=1 Tax=Agrocybe chaxingu TaxID=84603 RepID=A0A9W8JTB0_9AGAR|nr:hypothetical protein NLJ89_g9137 [Agrocybe chaxingu]
MVRIAASAFALALLVSPALAQQKREFSDDLQLFRRDAALENYLLMERSLEDFVGRELNTHEIRGIIAHLERRAMIPDTTTAELASREVEELEEREPEPEPFFLLKGIKAAFKGIKSIFSKKKKSAAKGAANASNQNQNQQQQQQHHRRSFDESEDMFQRDIDDLLEARFFDDIEDLD